MILVDFFSEFSIVLANYCAEIKRIRIINSVLSFSTHLTLFNVWEQDYDLRQEQMNKSSLLSSEKFLDGLLDMWTNLVRKTGYKATI